MQACCNSGPFIHLAQVEMLNVFGLFHEILTTPQVLSEISKGAEKGIREIVLWEKIKVCEVPQKNIRALKIKLKKYRLQDTELSVLCLNRQHNVLLFLTDDLEARSAAIELGLQAHGTVGVVARAYREKLITLKQAEKALIDLHEKSSLFVTKGIIDFALSTLRRAE